MKQLILISLLFITFKAIAIQPAELKCLDADISGGVNINWQTTTDIADFVSYQIYFSTSLNGTYNLLTTINSPATNTYSHPTAGADVNNCFYYIKTNGTSSTGFSDTLQTIQLLLSNPSDGTAILQWNAPSQPLPSTNSWYYILKEYPTGVWNIADSTQNTNYIDKLSLCQAQISYRISLAGSGCVNQSSIDVNLFKDLTPPDVPILDSVSINPITENIEIGWQKATANDTKAYIIYLLQAGFWIPIDTVFGINNTFYQGINANAQSIFQNYRIAAIDSCNNLSPIGILQHTIKLNYTINICDKKAELSWNNYSNLLGGVAKYQIFVSINNGEYNLAGEVTSTNTYTYNGLIDNLEYQFFVRVVGNSGITSSSSKVNFTFHQSDIPDYLYFRYATVNESQTVDLAIFVDTSSIINGINIYKKNLSGNIFSLIKTLSYNSSGYYYFTDDNVNTSNLSYKYFATVKDICNLEILKSDTVNTILLTAKGLPNTTNSLEWNFYYKFAVPILHYSINRYTEESPLFSSISEVTNVTNLYNDDVSNFSLQGAKFSYYVEAYEDNGNPYNFKDISRSNIAIATQKSTTYIPNAFTPDGLNPIFLPINVFVSANTYQFSVYARNGQLMFNTNNPNEGWDGKFAGEPAPQGIYIYRLIYDPDGEVVDKTGWITLLR